MIKYSSKMRSGTVIVMESMRGERERGHTGEQERRGGSRVRTELMTGIVRNGRAGSRYYCYSALNRAPPPPPRMIARIKARKRSAYSGGGTGLILCYIRTRASDECARQRKEER